MINISLIFFIQDIVVRLCFIIGNLTSDNSSISNTLYHTYNLSSSLDKILNNYFNKLAESDKGTGDDEEGIKKSIDVLIKVN